jgi:replicative DNA helicase
MTLTAEAALVGAVVREPALLDDARAMGVNIDSFENPHAQFTWGIVLGLAQASEPIELVSVGSKVERETLLWLIDATNDAPVAANVGHYAGEVVEAAWNRKAAVRLVDAARIAAGRKPFDSNAPLRALIAEMERDAIDSGTGFMTPHIADVLREFSHDVERAMLGKSKPGIPTGLARLDSMLSGWHAPDFTILAARPSVGKTTLGISFAGAATARGYKSAFFTIEMLDTQILAKEISRATGVFSEKFRSGKLTPTDVDLVSEGISRIGQEQRLFVNSRAGRTIETFEAEVRRLHRKFGIDIAFVDYIGLMRAAGRWDSRARELGEISGRIKLLAMDLKIPIVALAQVNREVERGAGASKVPGLSHLKDSGSLEQDADNVIFIHRDEETRYWLVVAKNRHGPVGGFEIDANLAANRFADKGAL